MSSDLGAQSVYYASGIREFGSLVVFNEFLLQGYLLALGMARTAQVKRDARIGEAEAKRDSGIKVQPIITFKVLRFHIILSLNNSCYLMMNKVY